MKHYDRKRVVITGGASGIGLATAQLLLTDGARVIVTGRTEKSLSAARDQLRPDPLAIVSDIASLTDIDALADRIKTEFGGLDALLVCAGQNAFTPFESVTEEADDQILSVNAKGAYSTVQKLAPLMAEGTDVVFITSAADQLAIRWPACTPRIRRSLLPIEEWSELPENVIKAGLQVYEDHQVSWMRADRELHAAPNPKLNMPAHGDTNWMRLQVDFPAELDEAMGVAMNKQGVRPKGYVLNAIRKEIQDEVRATRKSIADSRAAKIKEDAGSPSSQAEKRANATDGLQGKQLPAPAPETPEERQMLDENLRGLAVTLKRDGETSEAAFERIKGSTYVTVSRHDPYWPFYHVEYQFGRVILTINKAHPFYTRFYQPLVDFSTAARSDASDEGGGELPDATDLVVSLQLMLLSLARTQSQMTASGGEERRALFDTFGQEWSNNIKVQLGAG